MMAANSQKQAVIDSPRADNRASSANRESSAYFKFVGPELYDRFILHGDRTRYRGWKKSDIERINACAAFVSTRLPGLLKCASNGRQLSFFRAWRFADLDDKHSQKHVDKNGRTYYSTQVCMAATTPGAIAFSDDFFEYSEIDCKRMFVHELVHAADIGGAVAYSAEWANYVQMNSIKLSGIENAYGESLADAIAAYAVGKPGSDQTALVQRIIPMVCSESNERSDFRDAVSKGLNFNRSKNYSSAIECFRAASRQLPTAPMPYVFASVDFYRLSKRKDALKQTELASQHFERNGVQLVEPHLLQFLYMRALLLTDPPGDFAAASKLLDQILKENPEHKKAAGLKKFCLEKLRQRTMQ